MNEKKKKLVVIGIDSATFNLIKPFVEQGKLPCFKKLIEEGNHGILESTIPPITIPAWPAMFSGLEADKIGFFGFMKEGKIFSSNSWKDKSIFNTLNSHGKKIIAINIPGTYPTWEIDDIMVSGMLSPDISCHGIDKEELKKKGYIIEGDKKDAEKAFLARASLAEDLMGKNFDLFVVVLRYPDSLSHISVKDWKKYLLGPYEKMDEWLGKMLDKHSDCNFLIVSDHGTTFSNKFFWKKKDIFQKKT